MKFYHGTLKTNWEKIINEGFLWGYQIYKKPDGTEYMRYRYTYLTPCINTASKYGDVVLEIEYTPNKQSDNYFNEYYYLSEEPGQFSVFVPISVENIRKLNSFQIFIKKLLQIFKTWK